MMSSAAVIPQMSTETTMITHANTKVPPSDGSEDQNLQRSNKPRPLKIEQPHGETLSEKYSKSMPGPGFNFNQPVQQLNSDELLDLMTRINNGVKSGQFNSQLAQLIFRLYQQLKSYGEKIEQQHKNELNRVFVSLRQACCRDSVELRAMGWRPNLAHSQYYLNRSSNGEAPSGGQQKGHQPAYAHPQPPVSQGQHQSQHGVEFEQTYQQMAAPISAPPFGSVPMNPFAFAPPAQHHQPMGSHHQMVSHAPDMPQPMCTQPTVSQAAPSYYLIPATGAIFSHPNPAISMMPPPSPLGGPPMGFAMPPPLQQAPHTTLHQPQQVQMTPAAQYPTMTVGQNLMTTSGGIEQQPSPPELETPWPRGAVVKPSPKFTQPQKVPGKNMFRDEIIIRNADSGKIMGVKGRRVAVVEEISKTIISFQKVPQGVKERTLTITGNSEETIERAKILIEETIRRNVSPTRPECEEAEMELASGVLPEEEVSLPDSVPVSFELGGNAENIVPTGDDPNDAGVPQNELSLFP